MHAWVYSRVAQSSAVLGGSALAAGLVLTPKRSVSAEAPPVEVQEAIEPKRKPIYDPPPPQTTSPYQPPSPDAPKKYTPTDTLATYIRSARLQTHKAALQAEDAVNDFMNKTMAVEHDISSTIASLAPGRETGEKLLPGSIYVLVAAMAGSIVTRRSNILFRVVVPPAAGIGAMYVVLPHTRQNVGNLIWEWEKKWPQLANTHMQAQERTEKFVQTGIAHTKMSVGMVEDYVRGGREAAQDWLRKGK
ncbi:hypothetical protein K402DRAFT_396090 [Aulographum hederae CBS 113979]|uniref:MICOS complex subunit n=1 Tax=Aulographum hederae CBS 113979 TaxID=1176131 RepID=A0A6G1GTP5_9PEZI|nr:hypothetical protein K402DRAFT_396090 [Aulographum hederae CBS 113979]